MIQFWYSSDRFNVIIIINLDSCKVNRGTAAFDPGERKDGADTKTKAKRVTQEETLSL